MAKHLTFEERQFLYRLNKKGKSNTEIAELMGRHRSTIYRELGRNMGQRGYRPQQAQHLAEERSLASRRPHKMDDPDVHQYVQDKLKNSGRPTRSPAAYGATFRMRVGDGCRGKRFTIGSTPTGPSGSRSCVAVVGLQKDAGNSRIACGSMAALT